VAVASAGPYANHLHFAADRSPHRHLFAHFFMGQMLFLMPTNSVAPSTIHSKPAGLFPGPQQ